MNQSAMRPKRILVLLGVLPFLLLIPAHIPAEPIPNRQDAVVARLVCGYLQRGHLSRPELSEELSRRVFHRFLKGMDPAKAYFLKSDVDEFKRYETELADMLLRGDMSFAYKVYERFTTRLGQRSKLIEELVNAAHDFTIKEYLQTDFDALDYVRTEGEFRERWRKRIKLDLLRERIADKPLADAEARQKVLARYQGLLKRWKQVDNYDLMEIYLSDLTASVDPHSSYMSPTTLADFDIAMRLHLE